MPRLIQLHCIAPIIIATLMGFAWPGFGDDHALPPVSVGGDATKKATESYKVFWNIMREIDNLREDNFVAEPLIESKGHQLVPANTMLTIQSHTGVINVSVSRDGAIENFPISNELLAENPSVIANQPKGSSELSLQIRIPVPGHLRSLARCNQSALCALLWSRKSLRGRF
jgi:hypothetical protein